ncbi:MAG: hypothetical protein AB1405_15975 [Bdellovibrionota bacterium]
MDSSLKKAGAIAGAGILLALALALWYALQGEGPGVPAASSPAFPTAAVAVEVPAGPAARAFLPPAESAESPEDPKPALSAVPVPALPTRMEVLQDFHEQERAFARQQIERMAGIDPEKAARLAEREKRREARRQRNEELLRRQEEQAASTPPAPVISPPLELGPPVISGDQQ